MFIEVDCPGIEAAIEPILDAAEASGTTLFMGPGLLAGGTLENGKGKSPEHFASMPDAFIEHCPE